MANAAFDRFSQGQLGILEYLEHLMVVLEDEREQLSNAKASGDVKEVLQEQRCGATMLIVVDDDESHLRTVRTGTDANELADGDEPLASSFPDRQCQTDVILEIQLGGPPEGARPERRDVLEEAPIYRLGG